MSVSVNRGSSIAAATAAAIRASRGEAGSLGTERKSSEFWLNVGIWVEGAEGEPLFVSLPTGVALDDMKAQPIKGSNQDWINLAQTKNALLEFLQKHAASMEPGDRQPLNEPVIGEFGIEIYRRKDAVAAVGNTETNPLTASLMSSLLGRKAA